MPKYLEVTAAAILLGWLCFSQTPDEKGAKAVFFDTQTGKIVTPTVPRPAP
ncbi:MAG: hypothetical protein M3Y72_21935 [Acidobacteriota bacterium]|nr:hypothetical protein [Acidobacteriota bacterium]